MKGTRLLLVTSIVLAIYGGVNVIYCILVFLGASTTGLEIFSMYNAGFYFGIYLVFQGLIPLIAGGVGFVLRNDAERVKVVMIMAWILMIDYFGYFFLSYGQPWTTIVFDLGGVIVSLVYFQAARQNLNHAKKMGYLTSK